MELFYIPNVEGEKVELKDEQFRHAIKSLRKRDGDQIQFTDGKGVLYSGVLTQVEKRSASILIYHTHEMVPPEYQITLCLSLTKNIKRIEWAFEKITEMGISRIVPIICHRSERDTYNVERLNKILVSAMKQSQQAFCPILEMPTPIADVLAEFEESNMLKYIAHKSENSVAPKDNYKQGDDVVLLVGPEGDFTDDELELARKSNFVPLSLGNNRLRTETAAVVAVSSIHTLNI